MFKLKNAYRLCIIIGNEKISFNLRHDDFVEFIFDMEEYGLFDKIVTSVENVEFQGKDLMEQENWKDLIPAHWKLGVERYLKYFYADIFTEDEEGSISSEDPVVWVDELLRELNIGS